MKNRIAVAGKAGNFFDSPKPFGEVYDKLVESCKQPGNYKQRIRLSPDASKMLTRLAGKIVKREKLTQRQAENLVVNLCVATALGLIVSTTEGSNIAHLGCRFL